jgi:putative transposase
MNQLKIVKRHRFPPKIIQYAMWLYHLFNLSHRDVKDLKAQRGITISYEAIRLRCNKFGSKYAVADITNPDIIQT